MLSYRRHQPPVTVLQASPDVTESARSASTKTVPATGSRKAYRSPTIILKILLVVVFNSPMGVRCTKCGVNEKRAIENQTRLCSER